MHWDDLRIASAILRSGSYAGAAQQLGLNETTVSRRLARLESDLGFKVFDTADGERRPTAAGRRVLEAAKRMTKEAERLRIPEEADRPRVRRRIAAVEAMATHYLAPGLSSLIAKHPHLHIEILLSTEIASFSRWETDIALRLTRPERGNLVMRKLTDFEWVLVRPADREPAFVTGYSSQHPNKTERDTLRAKVGVKLPMIVVNGMSPTKRMLLNGDGIGFLPDFMCGDLWDKAELKLERLGLTRPIWLLVQEHLRDDPDTRIVTDWLADTFDRGVA
ncbi:MAG: LysR family transcriptional regulator [Parasphingopyxis sp.]|uniref:LysR family transcriptional regulator n=1 Tax=Parasphingopyxis sp. TaxID=1920299 RepID=UPI003FA13CA9